MEIDMKKIILLVLLIPFLFGASIQNQHAMVLARKNASTPTCDQSQFAEDAVADSSLHAAQYETSKYRASKFVYTGTNGKQICIIRLWLNFTGSNSHTYYARLYTDSGGDPSSAIGTSDVKELNAIGESEVAVDFTLTTPSSALANGTTYHVALYSATNDADDYASWFFNDEGTTEEQEYSQDGSSWSTSSTDYTFKFELLSQ